MSGRVVPIPKGFRAITPRLFVRGAARAIDFYNQAFGGIELTRLTVPSGKIVNAGIKIGDSMIELAEESPEWGNLSPQSLGGSPVVISLYVEDVDAVVSTAIAAGATMPVPVKDQFYGDRSGRLTDPFGHIWTVATHKEDVSVEEMQKRAFALFPQS
jgi:PhnB protein